MELDEILKLAQELQNYNDINLDENDDDGADNSSSIDHSIMSRTERETNAEDMALMSDSISSRPSMDDQAQLIQRSNSCRTASTSRSSQPACVDARPPPPPLAAALQGRRHGLHHTATSLKATKDPHSSISKRHPPADAAAQYSRGRIRPIIIHTYSPKVIHTSPSNFMWLVQSLTGSPETRLRCLQQSSEPHRLHRPQPHRHRSAASMPLVGAQAPQDNVTHVITPKPVYPSPALANHQITNPNLTDNKTLVSNYTLSTPISFNYASNQGANSEITSDKCRIAAYKNAEQSSSSPVSGTLAMNVSPRGPFSATELSEDGSLLKAPFISSSAATPTAPNWENWNWDCSVESSVHSNSSASSLLQEANPSCSPNINVNLQPAGPDHYLPDLNSGLNQLSVGFNCELPPDYFGHAQSNSTWANARPIPVWDRSPIDTFLSHTLQDLM